MNLGIVPEWRCHRCGAPMAGYRMQHSCTWFPPTLLGGGHRPCGQEIMTACSVDPRHDCDETIALRILAEKASA